MLTFTVLPSIYLNDTLTFTVANVIAYNMFAKSLITLVVIGFNCIYSQAVDTDTCAYTFNIPSSDCKGDSFNSFIIIFF